ncbi:MAG: dihydrolipoamide acetyltransferase family protein [Deltaproteobacteria bacterium]|nr:dihydrolipoamide acetyltransferase family protein [Deltaproteobacteria bacterium]
MRLALPMPAMGESIREGLLVRWVKKEGSAVSEKEPIVELETEKAVSEYESPFEGKLVQLLVSEGQKVPIGTPLAVFEISEEKAKKYLSLGIGMKYDGKATTAQEPAVSASSSVTAKVTPSTLEDFSSLRLPPLLRKIIEENNLSLAEVQAIPTSSGRLTKEDLLRYLEAGPKKASSDKEIITPSPIRLRIAENMSLSKSRIPHAGASVEVDLTELEEWRQSHKESFKKKMGSSLGHLPFVILAAVQALQKFPVFNGSFKEEGEKKWLEVYKSYNIAFALSTPQGLFVPVVRQAEKISFLDLTQRIEELKKKGQEGKFAVSDLTGATFTVNNPGALGGVRSNQIISYPQTAIIAIGKLVARPWVIDGKITIRQIAFLDLSFDHRAADGNEAIQFLEEVRKNLEKFDLSTTGI